MAPRSTSLSQKGGNNKSSNNGLKQGNLFSFFSKKKEPAPSTAAIAAEATSSLAAALVVLPPSQQQQQKQPQQQQQQQQQQRKKEKYSALTIGTVIEVYWSADDAWYRGTITKQRGSGTTAAVVAVAAATATGKEPADAQSYCIEYEDDGQWEWIDLSNERYRLPVVVAAKDVRGQPECQTQKKRRIRETEDEGDEEAEFEMPNSDNEYEESDHDGKDNDEDEEDLDDQWMVTDDDCDDSDKDEDDYAPQNKASKKRKKSTRERGTASPKKKTLTVTASHFSTLSPPPGSLRGGPSLTATSHGGSTTGSTSGGHDKTPRNNISNHNTSNSVSQLSTKRDSVQPVTPGTALTAGSSKTNSSSSRHHLKSMGRVSLSQSSSSPLPRALSSDSRNNSTTPKSSSTTSTPTPFEVGAVNPVGSHVHNHLAFLQHPRDAQGRSKPQQHQGGGTLDDSYDPRTLTVNERDWIKIMGKPMTDAVKQWWDLKRMYFDTVLLFKTGKFYEMFHMDADIGVQVCGLSYMKGHVAHAGFPEISYGSMSDSLVRAGYKVGRVEQTETPDQLNVRKKQKRNGPTPKVVNREVCSIVTVGTRTFCYLDDTSSILNEEATAGGNSSTGPLLAIREILLESASGEVQHQPDDSNEIQPVCEYGVTLVDAVRGSVTIGQFADDVLRSRLTTLLATFSPSEIILEGGQSGASPVLQTLIRSLQATSPQNIRVETILPLESFPQSTALDPMVRKQLERGSNNVVHPWDVQETLTELHRRKYFPRASKQNEEQSVARWPKVLKAVVEGNADLALASFGAVLFYLQRHLIDAELLSMGIVKAYIPPESAAPTSNDSGDIQQLAVEQNLQDSGVVTSALSSNMDQPIDRNVESETSFMSLDGTTLHNLEILTNTVDHKTNGSLWSKINYTKTPHGSRLLRAWLLRPLFRKADIVRRQDAVEELVSGGAAVALKEARAILAKCGDVERLLSRIHSMSGRNSMPGDDGDDGIDRYHPNERAVLYENVTYTKRKVGDFSKVLNGLRCASQIPELFSCIDIQSGLLRKVVHFSDQGGCFPNMEEELEWFFADFDCDQAAKGNFEPCKGIDPLYDNACDTVDSIVSELHDYRDEMCSQVLTPRSLAKSTWKYVNIKQDSKDKYLVELPASVNVPDDFIMKGKRGSGQKQINKYRTPVVEKLIVDLEKALDVQKARKAKGIEMIFAKFDAKQSLWAAAAQATALLDALGALAQTATKSGYTRPLILDCEPNESPSIKISQGRHPCVENTFNSAEFVPNDLTLGCSTPSSNVVSPRVLLLSGPNMGGKSTLLRQTCLIAILAQLGSFVPAAYCELTPIDRIFTRLGASDRILLNQSTFFVELAETAAALRGASRRSLVIMDELGRGTSTFDGTAIASAAVQHLVERSKCLSLFATHYHSLLDEWKENESVELGHMECLVDERRDESEVEDSAITFLYTLGKGVCPKSFAINVARLAGLPRDVLSKAKRISSEFELEMNSVERSRSTKTARSALYQKRAIIDAVDKGCWDDLEQIWREIQP